MECCHRCVIQLLSLYVVWMNVMTDRSTENQRSTDFSEREQHSLYERTILIFLIFSRFVRNIFSDVRNLSHSISRENGVT